MSEFWQFWFAYWWLLFPLAGMAYGAFGMWLNYKRSYQAMEVLKAFAANGREPPAEVMAALGSNPAGLNFSSCPSPQRTDPAFALRHRRRVHRGGLSHIRPRCAHRLHRAGRHLRHYEPGIQLVHPYSGSKTS
jgi:hypothetical protein